MLLEDDALAAALGGSGRAFVEETYDWDALLGRYEQFLGFVG
jgi:glycosyltransferase involved in cell wall biosynthesis